MKKKQELGTEMVQIAQRNHYEWKRRKKRRFNWKPIAVVTVIVTGIAIGATTMALGSSETVETTVKEAQVPTYEISHDYYPLTTVVTEIDHITNTVTVRRSSGHEYQFYGIEDWWPGDICSCIMYNKGTQNVEDDIIVMKHYNGVPSNFVLG